MNFEKNTYQFTESFLQEATKDFKLYPKESAWEKIRYQLHGNKKWPALMVVFLLISIGFSTATLVYYPPQKNNFTSKIFQKNDNSKKHLAKEMFLTNENISPQKSNFSFNIETYATTKIANNVSKSKIAKKLKDNKYISLQPKKITSDFDVKINNENENFILKTKLENITTIDNYNKYIANTIASKLTNDSKVFFNSNNNLEQLINIFAKNITTPAFNEVLNEFKPIAIAKSNFNKSKWHVQLYCTPSKSYRVLDDDKQRANYLDNNSIEKQSIENSNINNVIKSNAAIGFEAGVNFLGTISKNFYFKSGFQVNVRKYDIDAYKNEGTAKVSYVKNNAIESVSLKSNYSTDNTGEKVALNNSLYQISIPIGFQWDFLETSRWGLSIAATIQPTYTFSTNLYTVSTDYFNFIQGDYFLNKLNINSNFEFTISLKSGNNKWYIGPQIRQQLLSTYNKYYPIKEYRIDYGIRVGFTTNL
jgi:hypothetical protein